MTKLSTLVPLLCLGVSAALFAFQESDQQDADSQRPDHVPEGYQLVVEQDFDGNDSLEDVVCSDDTAWRILEKEDARYLDLFQASKYKPTHRSPHNIALFRAGTMDDFVLDLRMLQTGREYGHRDLCVFFGFQDPEHFYYVHMATKGDQNAHQVFIVDDAARTPITTKRNEGVDWGTDEWHDIRLVRDTSDGSIAVYFDDMETPIMEANDQTFGSGYIGVGSFDDTGSFDNVRIWADNWEANPLKKFSTEEQDK